MPPPPVTCRESVARNRNADLTSRALFLDESVVPSTDTCCRPSIAFGADRATLRQNDFIPESSRYWERPTPPTRSSACWRPAPSIFCKKWARNCIEEVHHLLAGSHREQRRALNLLKFLTNELKIVIVAVGTSDAFHALQTDVQVASRFEPLLIPRWTETDAFRAFVVAYGKLLPLRKASPYGEPEMIRVLIKRSDGITGRVTWLLGCAAEIAIQDGSEFIDAAIVERVSERLRIEPS